MRWKNKDSYDPWSYLNQLQNEINELFDVDQVYTSRGLYDRTSAVAIDVIETADDIVVTCELPGINEKDLDVSITSNVLTIKGKKAEDQETKKGKYYRKETWSGGFQRTISLPGSVDSEKIVAGLKNGMLTVTLPKKEEAKPKQISVNLK
ncbi:MAG: Hsp20/alpha crystallin family protein [Spirochaetales bacterium]|nr:Hsp20/alpha crystallin family protein [Spirochaetales bacterium]